MASDQDGDKASKKRPYDEKEEEFPEVLELLKTASIQHTDFSTITKLDIFGGGLSSLPNSLPDALPNLQILFLMKNKFSEFPSIIGSCKNLDMVSFKSNLITSIHPDALQPQLRWLILTNNKISTIPSSIGRCCKLQKVMLSGNKIQSLPKEIESCTNLELIRLASNELNEPPMSLLSLPNLGWIALSDNPFLKDLSTNAFEKLNLGALQLIDIDDEQGEILGKGASGVTRKILYTNKNGTEEFVAVKKYASTITSDGNPFEERRATLAASSLKSDCLVPLLGQNENGSLVMELLANYIVLGNPPSLKTCSRDVYDDELKLAPKEAFLLASQLVKVLMNLHAMGLSHGDFYSHNILVSSHDKSVVKLTDFGAAYFYDIDAPYGDLVEKIEMRAFGHFAEELIMLMERSGASNELVLYKKKVEAAADMCLKNSGKYSFVDVCRLLETEA